jgi:large conductance mechanosensitive channel
VFLVVKAVTAFQREQEDDPAGPTDVDVLLEIRDLLRERQGPTV